MISLDDLTGIPEDKRKEVVRCLDELMGFRDQQSNLFPVISGYNWYNQLSITDSVVTLSHLHETEAYKRDMLRDLSRQGYDSQTVLERIRKKAGTCLHSLDFRIKDEEGKPLQGLKIKDARTGLYLDLSKYTEPLIYYPEFDGAEGFLIDEDQGWELNLPFKNKIELMDLTELLLLKSSPFIYRADGTKLVESEEERQRRAPWTDAYRIPILVLGQAAVQHQAELPQFDVATRIVLIENGNEISFVIHKNITTLRALPHYDQLQRLGFREEQCLANNPFLRYIDRSDRLK